VQETDLKAKAALVGIPTISLVVVALFSAGYLLSLLLGLPLSLGFPLWVRATGGALILAGLSVMGWVIRRRGVAEVLVSTYVTFTKMAKGAPMEAPSGRVEPLVVSGPYRHVRHPLYFGVVVMALGWGLLTAYPFVLVATVVILAWFSFVIAPFEEKELRALFGDQYRTYAEEVPRMIPFTKRRRNPSPRQG
jgi:protein-S-isoprenylcysteine O-methyltransferase Ste14